ncbi:MAG TPA: ABC transporter ATP-binding protein [Solirubrobacteraceae bacterium]|jgi:branched-chain amino acid transport system ATP-binding protein
MSALLQTKDLAVGYQGNPVVRDLNLEVKAGEVVAILGSNGAGKTTTLMAIAGRLKPLAGSIAFDGRNERKPLHARAREGLSFVTEERSVFMRLSARDNLRVAGVEPEDACALFPELKPLLRRTAGLLSGGEQQMLTLARALARKPKLLLADELSLGLAPMVVVRLLDAVRNAAASRDVGVLMVEQHVHQALKYADRVYGMRRGEVILTGTPDEVRSGIDQLFVSRV